jgi:hypothetical protein
MYEIKHDMMIMAKNNPTAFMEEISNPIIERKQVIMDAIDERLIIGCSAQDHSGQQYFVETGGGSAIPGTTAFLMHNKEGRKWSDINIY